MKLTAQQQAKLQRILRNDGFNVGSWAVMVNGRYVADDIAEGDFDRVLNIIDNLQMENARLQADLAATRERLAVAEKALADIERNAPQDEPARTETWKWTFWYAGIVARSALQANQGAAEGE